MSNPLPKKYRLFLVLLFVVSFGFRVVKVNSYPPLLWDEAALGYNAYSILQTGKDEYGKVLPLVFTSFGDYKPGLYVYLVLPFIALFGLTPLAVRLPSIVAGSLSPILLFFLLTSFTKPVNTKQNRALRMIAVLASVILAFTPAALHFSRGAWEGNILLCELLLASWLFNKYLTRGSWRVGLGSSFVFALTFYTYQGAKLSTFIVLLSLLLPLFVASLQRRQLVIGKLKLLILFFPLILLSLPLVPGLVSGPAANRLKVLSLSAYKQPASEVTQLILESGQLDYSLFHSQTLFWTRGVLGRYFNHFSPRYLFFEGDWQNSRHSAPYIGLLLYPSLLFFGVGVLYALASLLAFVKSKLTTNQLQTTMFLWLFLAPLPAALTRDSVSTIRALPMVIPFSYFTALGVLHLTTKTREVAEVFVRQFSPCQARARRGKNLWPTRFTYICYLLFVICYLLSFGYYLDLYHSHLIWHSPKEWLYGYREAVVATQTKPYDQIVFSDFYGQPYIFYLFFTKFPPARYQLEANLVQSNSLDVGQVTHLANISFRPINWSADSKLANSLIILSHDEVLRSELVKSPDYNKLVPLAPVGGYSTFYAYETPKQ